MQNIVCLVRNSHELFSFLLTLRGLLIWCHVFMFKTFARIHCKSEEICRFLKDSKNVISKIYFGIFHITVFSLFLMGNGVTLTF